MTDKPNWTPGPWTATSEDNGEWGIDSENWGIAVVAACAGMEDPNGRSDANAHLIAAAPDLYAALDALIDGRNWSMSSEKFDAAKAALAKACGGQA